MKEKLTDVVVQFVHDQGTTGQIKIAGYLDGTREPAERTIDIAQSQSTHDRLMLILAMARMTNAKLQSVTISGGSVSCVAM